MQPVPPSRAPSTHDDAVWYRAVTLTERVTAPIALEADAMAIADSEYSRDCLTRWMAQAPFQDSARFHQRLTLDGLTERQLRALAAEGAESIRRRLGRVPAWVTTIAAALSQEPTFRFRALLTESLERRPTLRFLDVAAPFLDASVERLEEAARRLAARAPARVFDAARVGELFFPNLARALQRMLARTIVWELDVARMKGVLTGTTAEERFVSFFGGLREPGRLRSLYEEYPVLARLIVEHTERWLRTSVELLERVTADYSALACTFARRQALGLMVGLSGGLSDPHHGGRSVAVVTFESGTRVVYKPKSLAADAHFQDLLRWLTASGFSPGFRTLTILRRDGYGWAEAVSPASCTTPEEVALFYERVGGLLALLHITDATGLRADHLIAVGEHPMLIDVEGLFHPRRSTTVSADVTTADGIGNQLVERSLLRVGLLPERRWGHEAHGNHPALEGRPVDVLDYRKSLSRGFRSACAIMADRRSELSAPDGPIHRFADDEILVYLRSSSTYRQLLCDSHRPDVLRNALDRDRLFDALWADVPGKPHLERVVRSERDDLWRGDVPRFVARPGGHTLSGHGGEQLPDFFSEPSATSALRVIAGLNRADCDRQAWIIEASLASLPAAFTRQPLPIVELATPHADARRLRSVAQTVGDRLDALAIRGRDGVTWIGLDLVGRRTWNVANAGLALDSGLPGIVLYLAYLGAITEDARAISLAHASLGVMRSSTARRVSSIRGIGGFDGLGGLIYVLSHLAALWGRADLGDEAEVLARRLNRFIDDDDDYDVYAGSAGCILSLRSLAACRPTSSASEIAARCGHHLIRSARRTAHGLTWHASSEGVGTRSGLAFGNAGIAWSLAELHAWTGDRRFGDAAVGGFEAERERLRRGGIDAGGDPAWEPLCAAHGGPWPVAWCHGHASAAWAFLDHVPATTWAADVMASAAAMAQHDRAGDHSLCHGDMGRIEFLTQAASAIGDSQAARDAQQLLGTVLDEIERFGCRCGTPLGVETPGLLYGLAGIGYGLLRSASPDRVPSVLRLEPPPASRQ